MAKSPRPGHSKTRLCPPLRPEQAAQLSAAFLRDTTESIAAAALSAPIVGYAAYAPSGTEEAIAPHLALGIPCILADGATPAPRGVEGFGRCLLHAIRQLFAADHAAACVLSSDTPTLPTDILITAATVLLTGDERRVVLGACDDGGYYLLGMRLPHARLFADIAWSSGSVAANTRTRAAELGLDLAELPLWYDIDDAAALERLIRENEGHAAPWTRRAVRALGLGTFTHHPAPHERQGATLASGRTRRCAARAGGGRSAARHPGEHRRSSYPARERAGRTADTLGHYRFRAVRFVLRHTWPHGTVWVVLGVAVSLRALMLAQPPMRPGAVIFPPVRSD